jgi:DNA-directed RNA polymerase subunit L
MMMLHQQDTVEISNLKEEMLTFKLKKEVKPVNAIEKQQEYMSKDLTKLQGQLTSTKEKLKQIQQVLFLKTSRFSKNLGKIIFGI